MNGSVASRLQRGQHADRGERDPPRPATRSPGFAARMRKRRHRLVVVVQRLAHAHQDDVEGRVEQAEIPREHAHLAGDLRPPSGCATMPILPVRQKAQRMAQPTWVEMQKVCLGVSGM